MLINSSFTFTVITELKIHHLYSLIIIIIIDHESIAGHSPTILLGFLNNLPIPVYTPGWSETL